MPTCPVEGSIPAAMSQQIALARESMLAEFGMFTVEAQAGGECPGGAAALVEVWRSDGQIFAVPGTNCESETYLGFQFASGRPRPVIEKVIAVFGSSMTGWNLAHWFVCGNAMLPNSARPVDLLDSAPDLVVKAAVFDAMPPAA